MSMIFESIILPIINSALNLIPAMYLLRSFSDGKQNRATTTILPAFVVFTLTLMFVKIPLLKIVITTLCTFVYTYTRKMKRGVRFLLTFSYVAVCMISEVLTGITISSILGSDYAVSQAGIYNTIGIFASKLVTLTFCTIIVCSGKNILATRSGKQWTALYLLPLSTFFVMVYEHFSLYSVPPNSNLRLVAGISMLLLVTGNLLVFRIAEGIHRAIETENRLLLSEELIKKQSEQYDLLFSDSRNALKKRHDHRNFLLGVISETESGNIDKTLRMLRNELETTNGTQSDTISGNSTIDTVVSYKRNAAKEHGITIDLRHRGVSGINIPATDLSVLLGNAIDNAVDAVKALPQSTERKIELTTAVVGGMFCLTVSNPVSKDIDVSDLSTTKNDKFLHGFGIIGMKAIVSKHEGEMIFKCEDKMFTVMITMNNQ